MMNKANQKSGTKWKNKELIPFFFTYPFEDGKE